jgi:hypothetical protein
MYGTPMACEDPQALDPVSRQIVVRFLFGADSSDLFANDHTNGTLHRRCCVLAVNLAPERLPKPRPRPTSAATASAAYTPASAAKPPPFYAISLSPERQPPAPAPRGAPQRPQSAAPLRPRSPLRPGVALDRRTLQPVHTAPACALSQVC